MHYWINKAKNFIVTLRVSILAIFVILFVAGIFSLIFISYIRSTENMSYIALRLMQQLSSTVFYDIVDDKLGPVEFEARFSAELAEQGIIDPKRFDEWVMYTMDLVRRVPILQSAYWGDESGSYVIAREENDSSITTEIINRQVTPAIHQFIYRDPKGNILKQVFSNDFHYDPRVRPWYEQGKAKKQFGWTDIYVYQPSGLLGVTASAPVHAKNGHLVGVFGLSVSLYYLSKSIEHEWMGDHGIVYIVTDKGKLVAFPDLAKLQQVTNNLHDLVDVHDMPPLWLGKSFDIYKSTSKGQFAFVMEGKRYLATYIPMPLRKSHPWIVGVVAPEDDFIAQLKHTHMITTLVGFLILILGIMLMSLLSAKIAHPLRRLVKETEKIKRFELNDEGYVRSRITEVLYLSEAIYAMKKGLRSFQKYVPSGLVRQLIETGEDARIGGIKKPLAIFFSDIKGFTPIAESMDPDQLMKHLCEYFDEMSKIIIEQGGTVDKYMGDSIMAFWGAPLSTEEPCQRAASVALKCQQQLAELNKKWISQGMPDFSARIGIHWGEAIVGNLGSTERLNYTAIGDAINMASRLEGINKIYDTQILVSESVYQLIKNQFILRKLDYMTVKGKTAASFIYELVAEEGAKTPFDVRHYNSFFEQGFTAYQQRHWDEAIAHFKQCFSVYPTDKVAAIFIKRCETFKVTPPSSQWNGTWHFDEK